MRFAARTHPGRRGGENEDSIGWDESQALWFVADGMGGHARGDVASRIVKETLLAQAGAPLKEALESAHAAMLKAAAENPEYNNMGSTAVVARMGDGQSEIAWVGDSRAYLWRDHALSGVTRDHSFLELLREQQPLSEAELRQHPHRNLVTQTIGIGTPNPSVNRVPLHSRDWLLLCSDGLNDELEDGEIAAVLEAHPEVEAAADGLIAAALAKGGRDNVSVVIVEYDGPDGVSSPQAMTQTAMKWLPIAVGVLAAFLVAVFFWWRHTR
jgi:protein phosphatase